MTEIERINKLLKDKGGCAYDGRPNYRLVWSDDQTEVRKGDTITAAGICVCSASGSILPHVEKVKKYDYIEERWILEKLLFLPPNPELPNSGAGDYEPLWVFQDSDGNYLRPEWFAVEFILHCQQQGAKSSPSYWAGVNESKRKARKEAIENALGIGEPSRVEAAFKFREAVPMYGKYTAS